MTSAFGQDELVGKQRYPQFRVLSGLPGSGFGVLSNGRPGSLGAAALATPVGYTLGSGSYAVGVFNTGRTNTPFRTDVGDNEGAGNSNGSAFGMMGFSYRGYRLTVGGMVLSTVGDSVLNLQISPPNFGKLGVAFGVQDLFDTGGASGGNIDFQRHFPSRSLYIVGTYELARGTYVSLGRGERRFQGLFGNVSLPIFDRVRALAEYDGFNFNGGILYNTGRVGRKIDGSNGLECNLFLGTVRGKYGTAGVSFTF